MDASGYSDAGRLGILANPLRAEIYYRLVADGSSTASALATKVDASASLVSYHLRELARHGLVDRVDSEFGDGRERWWRALQTEYAYTAPQHASGRDRATIEGIEVGTASNQQSRLEQFRRERDRWGAEWADAAFTADFVVTLTPERLRRLYRDLERVVREAGIETSHTNSRDAEKISVVLYGFPIR